MKVPYRHYIDGRWTEPLQGRYLNGTVAQACPGDVEQALTAAQESAPAWAALSGTERHRRLGWMGQRLLFQREQLARLAPGPCPAAPLSVAGYFLRHPDEVRLVALDNGVEPLADSRGMVVKQLLPAQADLASLVWRLAPVLARGHSLVACVVHRPNGPFPVQLMALLELAGDLLPPGVLNVINGLALEAGQALAASSRAVTLATMPCCRNRIVS